MGADLKENIRERATGSLGMGQPAQRCGVRLSKSCRTLAHYMLISVPVDMEQAWQEQPKRLPR